MKKFLIILTIIIIVLGGFLYLRNRNSGEQTGSSSGSAFRNFFNFGNKKGSGEQNTPNETTGEFTNEDQTKENPTVEEPEIKKPIFTTNGPIIPVTSLPEQGQNGVVDSPSNGGTGGNTGSTSGSPTGSGTPVGSGSQCTEDDVIEFTEEEIAKLRSLEERFYAIAPTLRTEEDLQNETANYSNYKLLTQKYAELTTYCENTTPLLASDLNRRVSTPLYKGTSTNTYFANGEEPNTVIDMNNPEPKLKEIERVFRITIW